MSSLADGSHSRAVLVGFASFDHFENVAAAAENIDGLREVFTDVDFWGLPRENCRVVSDAATSYEVLEVVEDCAASATDTLIVYYVGHGALDFDGNEELFLALPGSDRNRHYKFLRYDDLRRIVLGADAKRKVVILDCCHSGQALSSGWLGKSDVSSLFAAKSLIDGACILTATPPAGRARAVSKSGRYTAFSGELLRALEEGIPESGEYLDMGVIFEHLRRRMRSLGLPEPQMSAKSKGAEIILGRNRAQRKVFVASPSSLRPPRLIWKATMIAALSVLMAATVAVLWLIQRHETDPKGRNALPSSGNDSRVISLVQPGSLTTCADLANPPFQQEEGGKVTGFDVDLLNLLAEDLKVRQKFVNIGAYQAIIEGTVFDTDTCDIGMGSFGITADRFRKLTLSQPYLVANQALVVRNDSPFRNIDDFNGKTIGLVYDTAGAGVGLERQEAFKYKVTMHGDYELLLSALRSRKVDGAVIEFGFAYHRAMSDKQFRVIDQLETNETYWFVAKGNDSNAERLIDRLNKVISSARKDGRYASIHRKWFGIAP